MEEQRFSMGQGGGTLIVREDGPRAVLTAERTDDKRGLYKAYLRGKAGRLLLGTLMPEDGLLRLRRTYSLDELRRKGCWPVERAEAELAYAFQQSRPGPGQGERSPGPPKGWNREREPCRLLGEPMLRHAAREIPWGLVRREAEGFDLALPFRSDGRFPITPLFCFARLENLGTGRYVVYHFNEKGLPALPKGE